ncbi:MAG: 3-keto-5-aminohexanoate cleavage protein [Planctomycetota bacterium]|nr:3-keto-5-aminohexanoate cleavage protein [Planctomycetota bacterium]
MSLSDKVIVTCALTGALANRKQCPGVPYSPVEIAEEALRAYDAGASVVHIHAREDDGTPTWDPKVFMKIREEVKARCPIIINFSTGSLDDDTSQQETMIRECKPDIAALNMGTMNYAKYSKKRKSFVFDMVFPNPFSKIERLLRTMNEAGVKPELECFDSGHTNSATPLIDMGLLKAPYQFSFIVNVLGGMPATVESLQFQSKLIPAGAHWEVIGISHCQWRMVASALVLGGNIRVGLEDHFYLPNGEMAKSNGDLVAKAAELSRTIGREPMTVEEARASLGLPPA